jgi:hypothetical protein
MDEFKGYLPFPSLAVSGRPVACCKCRFLLVRLEPLILIHFDCRWMLKVMGWSVD